MRCDVLAIGTELLLGQIVDTNSAWIGEQLAAAGIDTFEHRKVGDNLPRMVDALRNLLDHADAVIVCGGLGPTPDDVTREAIAAVMGSELERRPELVEHIAGMFGARGRDMPENNLRQADVPVGGDVIPNPIGTAPGLRCEVHGGRRVVYAVPGVPYEMQQMVTDYVVPDLLGRSGERAVIVSRSLKTWGTSESGLAEMIADRVDAQSNPTMRSWPGGSRASTSGSRRRPRPRRTLGRSSSPRSRRCAPCSATSCSASTTRRWSTPCSAACGRAAGPSASPNP